MTFLNPTYLWALFGLLVPIAIHLWSKKEGKTIKVGSIELLRESESKQTSSFKPNEFWLLVLRMLIISLIIMVLAEPQWKLKSKNSAITYLIEPSLLSNQKASNILNSIDDADNIRLLMRGFPEFKNSDLDILTAETPNYWQLANEMYEIATDSIVVYTNALNSGFKGMRPVISKNIEWILLDPEQSVKKLPIKARKIDANIELLSMNSNTKHTTFEKTIVKASDFDITELELVAENSIKILMYYDDTFVNDSKILEASLVAASKHINKTFEITKTKEITDLSFNTFDLIIWLSENNQSPNEVVKLLEYSPDSLSNSLIVERSIKNHFYLATHLNTENSIQNHLPEQLLNILDLNSDLNKIILENDKRVFSKSQLSPTVSVLKTQHKDTNFISISKWIWLILGLTLLGERLLASYRKQ
jgi:hypothetical protein